MDSGPNFLGIGAPRCGTTWLHRMLKQHPQVWLPPIKELHYFDSIDPTTRYAGVHRLGWRVRHKLGRRAGHYAAGLLGPLAGSWRHKAVLAPGFDRRFFMPGGSVEWYRSLFDDAAHSHRRVGEITPGYFVLSEPMIAQIRRDTRVDRLVLLLRDPMEAAWSGFGRMLMKGQTDIAAGDLDRVLRQLANPASMRRRLYAQNLSAWLKVFPREQMFIGFYEELSGTPGELLERIAAFLSLDAVPAALRDAAAEKVHSSKAARGEMPPAVAQALAQHVRPDLERLVDLVGGPSAGWLERARAALS